MAHIDSTPRNAVAGILALLALSCAAGGSGCDGGAQMVGAQREAGAPDASVDARVDEASTNEHPCDTELRTTRAFIDAHSACAVDEDCSVAGQCATSLAVSNDAREEAEKLVAAGLCPGFDGPGYFAVCRNKKCELLQNREYCGAYPTLPGCGPGLTFQRPGCGESISPIEAGCFATCDVGQIDPCAPGYTCRQANINPCEDLLASDAECGVCTTPVSLCLPSPTCDLVLSVLFDGEGAVTLRANQGAWLSLGVENTTDAALTFTYDEPCHGLEPRGLADFDVWGRCTAGACAKESTPVTITLAPREKRQLRGGIITPDVTPCNAGQAEGTYTASFSLPGLAGATACGPTPAQLTVDPERRHAP